jgi:hypothetical protein
MYFVYGEYSGKATAAANACIRANRGHFEHLLCFFSIQ